SADQGDEHGQPSGTAIGIAIWPGSPHRLDRHCRRFGGLDGGGLVLVAVQTRDGGDAEDGRGVRAGRGGGHGGGASASGQSLSPRAAHEVSGFNAPLTACAALGVSPYSYPNKTSPAGAPSGLDPLATSSPFFGENQQKCFPRPQSAPPRLAPRGKDR